MTILDNLKAFDVDNAEITLWVFKKSSSQGDIVFTGRWLETSDALNNALKETVNSSITGIDEIIEYGLLTENHESSALRIDKDETHAERMLASCADIANPSKKINTVKHIENAAFYVIQFVDNTSVLYAVRKTDSSWRTKKSQSLINAIFKDNTLELNTQPEFSIAKFIDFFVLEEDITILHKKNFESTLMYKEAHKDDFIELQGDTEFQGVFSDLAPLITNVGENKIQLRRMAAIKQKAYYRSSTFMSNLKDKGSEFGLNLNFDEDGKIIPCDDTWRDIIKALLDHRLSSPFSQNVYDVPDTKTVTQT